MLRARKSNYERSNIIVNPWVISNIRTFKMAMYMYDTYLSTLHGDHAIVRAITLVNNRAILRDCVCVCIWRFCVLPLKEYRTK